MKIITGLLLVLFLAPASFSFKEEAVSLEVDGAILKGTLSTSGNDADSQVLVILIAGSGPTDRNGNNPQMKNNSLKMISEVLVENGYACLRYDKRGIAESKLNDKHQQHLSFDDFISDASSWVNNYASDVRFHSIILAGHSQGSLVAICAANGNENVDGVISLAGAGEGIHEILKWQLANSLTTEMQGVVNSKLDTLASGDTLSGRSPLIAEIFHPSVQPFLISWMKYDPAREAAKLKVPFLIINGTTDLQITVEQAKKLHEAQSNASLKIIKNMNHILKFTKEDLIGPQLEIYSDPDIPLHKKLPKVMLKWLKDF